jgi:hypothetical protein
VEVDCCSVARSKTVVSLAERFVDSEGMKVRGTSSLDVAAAFRMVIRRAPMQKNLDPILALNRGKIRSPNVVRNRGLLPWI